MAVVQEATRTTGIWPDGSAFIEGGYVPIAEAKMPVTDWGFTRSDATYDVVHVWQGSFFRLDDHLDRFENSLAGLRLSIPHDRQELTGILAECVRLTGHKNAYVAMVCSRGRPKPGEPYHPAVCVNRFIAYALPFIWLFPEDVRERGLHLVVGSRPRIPEASIDPVIKNYHWGDLTHGLFEAHDRGADSVVLLDQEGYVTEGPGFNVFAVKDGTVCVPARGTLEGITRKATLDLCQELDLPTRVGPLTEDELKQADEAFITTTAGGVMPVTRIDERIMSNDRPGPVSSRLAQVYWQKHEEGWRATPIDYAEPAG